MQQTTNRRRTSLGLAVALAATLSLVRPAEARGFNDEYVFAATRGVNQMHVHPALKVPLFPLTVAVDVALLPFALIAGSVT